MLGVDVLFFKENVNSKLRKVPDHLQGVCSVSRKAADGLCNYAVDLTVLAILKKSKKAISLFDLGSAYALVIVKTCILPVLMILDEGLIMFLLCFKT